MKLEPITLSGTHVRIEPLEDHHAPGLLAAATDPVIFRWMSFSLASEENVLKFLRRVLKMREGGVALPFAILSEPSGEVIGSTGYWHVEPHHRRLEIGGSWLTPKWQRTGANTEAKLLLLQHAFESLQCIRVEFLTHILNETSRTALKRLGATEEGVLRNHMIQPDGSRRHSACFSIIAEEWPRVRSHLAERLARHAGA